MLVLDVESDQVTRMMWERRESNPNALALLRAIAREQDAEATRWEHFKAWFVATRDQQVWDAYPGIVRSVLYGLHPEFDEHYETANCPVTWWRSSDGVELEPVICGRFQCKGDG